MFNFKKMLIGALALCMVGMVGCAETAEEPKETASAEPTAEVVEEKAKPEEKKDEQATKAEEAPLHEVLNIAFFGTDDKRDEGGAADAIKIISMDK